MMSKLEKIYKIKDPAKRYQALVAYAQALKIPVFRVQRPDGAYDYDKLTVLVYDAEKSRQDILRKNTYVLISGVFIFIILAWCIYIMARLNLGQ